MLINSTYLYDAVGTGLVQTHLVPIQVRTISFGYPSAFNLQLTPPSIWQSKTKSVSQSFNRSSNVIWFSCPQDPPFFLLLHHTGRSHGCFATGQEINHDVYDRQVGVNCPTLTAQIGIKFCHASDIIFIYRTTLFTWKKSSTTLPSRKCEGACYNNSSGR